MSLIEHVSHQPHSDDLSQSISCLAKAVSEATQQRKAEFEWCKSHETFVILKRLEDKVDKLIMGQAEIEAALAKIDAATNKLATNVQAIADTDQKISDEIDAFLANVPVGTVLTDAQAAKLQSLADLAQTTSDASDAQVAVLQAIAAKGAVNPVPIPVPPPVTP